MVAAKNNRLTFDRADELLKYEPLTGSLTWKKKPSPKSSYRAGDVVAGSAHGYLITHIDGKVHYAHRLAWLLHYGYTPEQGIDHVNHNGVDNRMVNLREVNQVCNGRNRGNQSNTRSGVKGVRRNRSGSWTASVSIGRKHRRLGRYKHFHNAVCARLAAEQCLNWEGCDSSSPAYICVQGMMNGSII